MKYIVRYYSHLYVSELIEKDDTYGYFKLVDFYSVPEYSPRPTNNYIDDIVKIDIKTVRELSEDNILDTPYNVYLKEQALKEEELALEQEKKRKENEDFIAGIMILTLTVLAILFLAGIAMASS